MITLTEQMIADRDLVQHTAIQEAGQRGKVNNRVLFGNNAIHAARMRYGMEAVQGWISEVLAKVGGTEGNTQWRVK